MEGEELLELQEVVQELVAVAPIEALPVEALPVQAIGWFARALRFFGRHAYLLAFLGALVENTILLGFLLPGGAIVALSAAGARTTGLSLPVVAALATLGMIGGAVIDYTLGRTGVAQILRQRWTGRVGRHLAEQLERAAPLLGRHGWWMMLLAHTFGHGRSSLAMAAGASRLPLRRFLAIEAPAAILWGTAYASGGYFLAAEWQTLELTLRRAGWIGLAVLLAGVGGWWYWRRWQSRRRLRPVVAAGMHISSPEPAPAPPPLVETSTALVRATAEAEAGP